MRCHLAGGSKLHGTSGGAEIWHRFDGVREKGCDSGNMFVPKRVEANEVFVKDFILALFMKYNFTGHSNRIA